MDGRCRRWMILVVAIWLQALTGTNFDFSSYSSELKAALKITQVQLNYLAVASDLGKAFGWSSGLALLYFPLPAVLFLAAGLGSLGYGLQWTLITGWISIPYALVFVLCLSAGLSICWFNTLCFVLCIQNFTTDRSLALSLTVSFNGLSAALYGLAANAINGPPSSYLLLNAAIPFFASVFALIPILHRPPPQPPQASSDRNVFLVLNTLAFLTGLYLLFHNPNSPNPFISALILSGAVILLAFPLVVVAIEWAHCSNDSDGLVLYDLQKALIVGEVVQEDVESTANGWLCYFNEVTTKDRITVLGEEHGARRLVRRLDFWLYYISYFCGGTVGLVYSNNLGQIAQSLGQRSQTTFLVNVYSSCSFFGRLLSAAPDFFPGKIRFARTGWLAAALVPMPLVFYKMSKEEDGQTLVVGTALIGLSSGFIFAAAVSVTSELFGPSSFAVNHNIVITNIPLGSLIYGLLAALVYDANGSVGVQRLCKAAATLLRDGVVVCMGPRCYGKTFLGWGCISMLGLACGVALYLRTRAAYRSADESGG
ncbi:protein NUCLEAR FUSION DEFECTIVE 4-like [Phalaenopsis equestris]|uniref:protein NUCLEAR FUSION DEFECTIVE 4-like n=1 Tax=Phalaenopsis equestris TaxID=78828 RepID=UPI0009E61FC1|nr:protein NUCLEAR FUSION DEFECTIVE 4-like [Phalaenopsis equestris]